jgi:P-type E1-E2 ATPase
LAGGLGALTAFAANLDLLQIALLGLAGQAAVANPAVAHLAALNVARGVLQGLRRGVAFRTADAFDAAGRVTLATFCARGTLLLGEPEVANVEPVGEHDASQVVALIAGAESGASHPVATAVLRAARARGIRPDGTRSHNFQPGLGITAVASSGQRLVVGSRALMLQEKVSVASAEAQVNELEALGRSVLLVALGGRLVGVVGLQDGLRPGARAAVQLLLDVGVEPVLLSGDARETCETLGRALDIEHVRPEILPPDRGEEIRRMSDGGVSVAVIGKSPIDDQALSASDVSVALCSAGATTSEWSVQLAADDVRDAAYAIRLAHDTRRDARSSLAISLAPAVAGALATAFSLVPVVAAPVAAALGAVAGLYLFRSREES